MTDLRDIASWPDRVESLVARIGMPLREGRVIAECESTQDLARRMGSGALVVAGRQRAGRGQRGNQWIDTGSEGLAFSVALPATVEPDRSHALAAAIVASLKPVVATELKLPNDVLCQGRKLSGVLIEQADGVAVIGVGINVLQEAWPEALGASAISLVQAGVTMSRIEVLELLLPDLVTAWSH
jgi:BirA family biotin operon repressor/biotin-[acetyl-CoA-carboxylase] ligase